MMTFRVAHTANYILYKLQVFYLMVTCVLYVRLSFAPMQFMSAAC